MAPTKSKGKRVLLFAALGCGALVGMCCLSSGGLYMFKQSRYESGGVAHAKAFLDALEHHNYGLAFAAASYHGGTGLDQDQSAFEGCIRATVLGDITGYECHEASGNFVSDRGVDVDCAVTSAAHGQNDVTIHVNSPDDTPYLGFVWFSASAWTGPAWHGDACASWSGREYFKAPPEGRVRP